MRERFGLAWSARDEQALRLLGRTARATTPLVPRKMRVFGPAYLKWRRDDIDASLRPAAPQPAPALRVA
jgi:uncharacterized protein (DUF2236 family)